MSASAKERRRRHLLALHRAIADSIEAKPAVIGAGRREIERRMGAPRGRTAMNEQWKALLELPPREIARAIVAETPEADELRAHSPLSLLEVVPPTSVPRPRRESSVEKTKAESKLARARLAAGLTQEQVARATGIHPTTYWRLERRRIPNPPVGYLAACARVLAVPLAELIEDEWLSWGADQSDPR